MRHLSILAIFVVLVGCMAVQRLNMQDVRADKYFYQTYTLNKSIQEIARIIFDYSSTCRPLPELTVDPTNKIGFMAWKRYFTNTPTIVGVIDFIEVDNGKTVIVAHWYYSSDGVLSDEIVSIIETPGRCRD
jgi:hypothetical protein